LRADRREREGEDFTRRLTPVGSPKGFCNRGVNFALRQYFFARKIAALP
jgi:hypothetical protein